VISILFLFSQNNEVIIYQGDALFTMDENGSFEQNNFVDTGATLTCTKFVKADCVVQGAVFEGIFTSLDSGTPCPTIVRQTDANGEINITLPPGKLDGALPHVKDKRGNTLKVKRLIKLRPPIREPNDIPPPPEPDTVIVDSLNIFSFSERYDMKDTLILGDHSGSMSQECRMTMLKTTFKSLFEQCTVALNIKVAFFVWDDELDAFPSISSPTFVTPENKSDLFHWIDQLDSRNGTVMKQAVVGALARFPSIAEKGGNVIIICDGDIDPFLVNGESGCGSSFGNEEWASFRATYPNVRFHFVPVGSQASHELMREMALIGNGTFTLANA
jgi:hypothetical protein